MCGIVEIDNNSDNDDYDFHRKKKKSLFDEDLQTIFQQNFKTINAIVQMLHIFLYIFIIKVYEWVCHIIITRKKEESPKLEYFKLKETTYRYHNN